MEAWIKQNVIALLIAVGSLVGVYGTLQSNMAVDRAEIKTLKHQVENHNKVLKDLPAIQQDVKHVTEEVKELKPIMSDLAKGVQGLNITLAKLEGKLESKEED